MLTRRLRLAHSATAPRRLAAVVLVALFACNNASKDGGPPSAKPSATPASSPGCVAAEKKLAECAITAEAAGLGKPCDERVAACIAGQGCEAIRAKQTGCVFE